MASASGIGAGGVVRPVRGQGVERVGHRDDAGAQRNRRPGDPVGIALPVPFLMMVPDDGDLVLQEAHLLEDPHGDQRMLLDDPPLVGASDGRA